MLGVTMNNEKKEAYAKDCPLSVDCWIIFLNDKLKEEKYPESIRLFNPILTALIAYIAFMIASLNTVIKDLFFSPFSRNVFALFAFLIFVSFVSSVWQGYKVYRKRKVYSEILTKIIDGELHKSNEIRLMWQNADVSMSLTRNIIFSRVEERFNKIEERMEKIEGFIK